MRSLKIRPGLVVVICGLLCAFSLAAAQRLPQTDERGVSLLKVGPADVSNGEHITLQHPTASLFGHARNYQHKEFYALLRPRDASRWYVAAASESEPGGIFNIEGVRFPQAGEFELVVGMGERDALTVGAWMGEAEWAGRSLALTQRVFVTVENAPATEVVAAANAPHLSILSVADVSLDPRETNTVPAGGDVVLQARGLPAGSKLYLAVRAPYTDLCHVLGPAKKDAAPDLYILHSAAFQLSADPQQIHFDLIAFASAAPFRAGPMSWQSFRLSDIVTSPTVRILIEGRQPRSDGLRVPFIAITRVGQHALAAEPAGRRLEVKQGDQLEVSAYERTVGGTSFWALTRPKGSDLWLAQGPMIPRGLPSAEVEDGQPAVTWVLPGLRFERPDAKGPDGTEFEVMAVLSHAVFPYSWISSASLSALTIETISRTLQVNVNDPSGPTVIPLSITHVGGQEAVADAELTVGRVETVVVERPEDFSPVWKIYVGKHVSGASTWSFVEAMPNGKTHFIPALSFTNPHAAEGTRYQLVAIATKGPLPAFQTEYQDFLPHVVASSNLINVRYSGAAGFGLLRWLLSWFTGEQEPAAESAGGQEVSTKMWLLWLLVIIVLLFVLAAAAWFLFNSNPALAGEIADTLRTGHAAAKKRFVVPESATPGYFLFGVGLLIVVLYIIKYYYLPLYTMIVATVTGLPPKASAELALWIILITALAGIFADISAKLSKQAAPAPAASAPTGESGKAARAGRKESAVGIYRMIFAVSLMTAVILWVCQGLIYVAPPFPASSREMPADERVRAVG